MTKNYGLIIEPIAPEDFVLGSDRTLSNKFSGRTIIKEDGNWGPHMENEPQAPVYETNSCATFGTLTAVEALKKFLYQHEPDFSDRFVSKGSGTDPLRGNTPKAPAEWMRKNWTVFEAEWPASAAKTVEEFFADLPQNLKTLAIGRGAEWDFGYEYIPTTTYGIKAALLLGTAAMSVPAWFKDENGKYFRPPGVTDGHWVAIQRVNENGEIVIKDTYEPYDKTMRADYTPQVAMGYYLKRQIKQESAWAQFLAWLHKLVFTKENDTSLLTVDHTTVEPTVPPAPTIEMMATAIKNFEGWFPGSRSWRNNNPGNCKYSTQGYAAMYKPVLKDEKGFAVFKDYATGWKYLNNLLKEKCKKNPEWSIQDLINEYAPAEDKNEPQVYANYIAVKLGVETSYQLKNFI